MAVIVREANTIVEANAADLDFIAGLAVDQIAPGVVSIYIPTGGIVSAMILDGAVITSKILDGAVTAAKIADNAVTSAKILNGSVTPDKLDRDYMEPGEDVAPQIEYFDDMRDGSSAITVASGNSNVAHSFDIILPNNGVTYDLFLDGWVSCTNTANGENARMRIGFYTTSNAVLSEGALQINTRADLATVRSAHRLLGRSNETIRCRSTFSATGGGTATFRQSGLAFRGIPRK